MKRGREFFLFIFVLFLFSIPSFAAIFDSVVETKAHGSQVYSFSWSSDGSYLAVGGVNDLSDLVVYEWDGLRFTQKDAKDHGTYVYSVAWSPDGSYLAVGGTNDLSDVIVYEWDGSTLTQKVAKDHGDSAHSVAWSPDGSYLAVGGYNGSNDVIVYEWNGSTLTQKVAEDHGSYVRSVAWNPDGHYLAVGGSNGSNDVIVYEWNGSTLTQKNAKSHGNYVRSVAWSPDGSYLAVGGYNSSNDVIVYEWDGSTLTQKDAKDHGTYASSVAWNSDGSYLAVGGLNSSDDLIVYEWNGSTLTQKNAKDHGSTAHSAEFSPDGSLLAVGGSNVSDDMIVYSEGPFISGIPDNIYYYNSVLFDIGARVIGDVKFKGGFSVGAGKNMYCDVWGIVNGTIDLNGTGRLNLDGDLYFGSHITGGVIAGRGNTLFLERNLTTTPDSILTVTSDLVIDGQWHDIELDRWSRFYVESNTTLTLRNVRLKNKINSQSKPPIILKDETSKLALYNVEIACVDDFYFEQGSLFIHYDVVVSGTSKFFYSSSKPLFFDSFSSLFMDHDTTFYYASSAVSRSLIHMQDHTSVLFLNGATLASTTPGVQLTIGTLILDHVCTFSNQAIIDVDGITFGDGVSKSNDLNLEVLPSASYKIISGKVKNNNVGARK
jgi:WD40 repeat protein